LIEQHANKIKNQRELESTDNIPFPIGTILLVTRLYDVLNPNSA